ELFSELEFAALSREYSDAASAAKPAAVATRETSKADYSRIGSLAELENFVESLWSRERFGISISERDGLPFGVAIAPEEGKAALIDLARFDDRQKPLAKIKEILENGLVRKVVHDWKGALTSLDRLARQEQTGALANESDGSIQDFASAIRIEGVEEDTLIA